VDQRSDSRDNVIQLPFYLAFPDNFGVPAQLVEGDKDHFVAGYVSVEL
jgi:hypothetical protein